MSSTTPEPAPEPRPESTHSIRVKEDHAGQRLDRILAQNIADVSRSRIKVLIESGHVTVDGEQTSDASARPKAGAELTLSIPPAVSDTPLPQKMPLDIRFEDEHLIVLNKPAGLVVHPAAGNPDSTLVNALLAHCGDSLNGIGGVRRPGIVHRLDKDTSGLLVAAKTELAHHGLSEQFAIHSIERRYDALVWGLPSPMSGTISGPIGRSRHHRKKMAVVNFGGKDATTHYRVIQAFGLSASHVACELETGRTHQIRVHMTHLGHSLIGDQLYGRATRRGTDPSIAAAVKDFSRQALHAAALGFRHPVTEDDLFFEADPPDDFTELKKALEQYSKGAKS